LHLVWSRPGLASSPQVAVVRQRGSGQIFAMKMLHKWEMLKRAEVSLGSSVHCKWVGEGMLAARRRGGATLKNHPSLTLHSELYLK
jgi:hypothetical protein